MAKALTTPSKRLSWEDIYENQAFKYYMFERMTHNPISPRTPVAKLEAFWVLLVKHDPEYKQKT